MSLSGLLRVITDDPELRRALDEAESPASPGGDLIAPPALRPFLVAALAGAGRAADSAATDADVAGAAHGAGTDAAGGPDGGARGGGAPQRRESAPARGAQIRAGRNRDRSRGRGPDGGARLAAARGRRGLLPAVGDAPARAGGRRRR